MDLPRARSSHPLADPWGYINSQKFVSVIHDFSINYLLLSKYNCLIDYLRQRKFYRRSHRVCFMEARK